CRIISGILREESGLLRPVFQYQARHLLRLSHIIHHQYGVWRLSDCIPVREKRPQTEKQQLASRPKLTW
ncbi:hypothetical protein M1709_22785, partial [Salmonella enterica subsp. enterica serovar Carrau]|nr:hypothetical protein [Salmonella enterica subsp. enterica serovar Carrau]